MGISCQKVFTQIGLQWARMDGEVPLLTIFEDALQAHLGLGLWLGIGSELQSSLGIGIAIEELNVMSLTEQCGWVHLNVCARLFIYGIAK
jgi:hypothetical protein